MAATAVSVVIFLCGVLVGRGVRADRVLADGARGAGLDPVADLAPSRTDDPPTPAPGSDPRNAAPPPEINDLSYPTRLEAQTQPQETLTVQAPPPLPPPVTAAPAARAATTAPAARPTPTPRAPAPPARSTAPAAAPANAPTGDWVVQVAALNVRSEADEVARRYSSKGYAAFVVSSGTGPRSVFRVRIGPFVTRGEADAIAARLKREEQSEPWVTR